MPHFPIIPVWEGCDPGVDAAVRKLQEEWRPYSMTSRSKRIDRLIQQVIDPAVAAYAATPTCSTFCPVQAQASRSATFAGWLA